MADLESNSANHCHMSVVTEVRIHIFILFLSFLSLLSAYLDKKYFSNWETSFFDTLINWSSLPYYETYHCCSPQQRYLCFSCCFFATIFSLISWSWVSDNGFRTMDYCWLVKTFATIVRVFWHFIHFCCNCICVCNSCFVYLKFKSSSSASQS